MGTTYWTVEVDTETADSLTSYQHLLAANGHRPTRDGDTVTLTGDAIDWLRGHLGDDDDGTIGEADDGSLAMWIGGLGYPVRPTEG